MFDLFTHASCPNQISVFAFTAIFSGVWYGLWLRLQLQRRSGIEVDGDMIWRDLGRFAVSICSSSVAGVVYSFAQMQIFLSRSEADSFSITDRRHYELQARSFRHATVDYFFQGVQIVFVINALNKLVLRVSDHASHSYYNDARDFDLRRKFDFRDCMGQYKMYYLVRSMNVVALMAAFLTFVALVVRSAFAAERAALLDQAAASLNTAGHATVLQSIQSNETNSMWISSARHYLFAVTWVFAFAKFLLFFPACIVMFRRVQRRLVGIVREMDHRPDCGTVLLPFEFSPQSVNGQRRGSRAAEHTQTQIEMEAGEARRFLGSLSSAAAAQRVRFTICLALALISLLVLASYAVVSAVARINERSSICERCGSCQSVPHLIRNWMIFTPELRPLLLSLSTALPQILSLWLMMSRHDRDMMAHPARFRSDLQQVSTLIDIDNSREAVLRKERLRMGIDLL